MMGWEESFLQKAVDTCTNLSGQIEDCPLFTIQDANAYSNCNVSVPNVLAKENILGGLANLPGNPPIAYGPAYAIGAAAGGNSATATTGGTLAQSTTASAMTLSYSAGISLASTDTYVPGAIFALSTGASFSASATASPAPSSLASVVNAVAVSSTLSLSPSFFSTAYSTLSPNQVEEILWVEEVVTVTEAATETATVTVAGSFRKRHLHGHGARRF